MSARTPLELPVDFIAQFVDPRHFLGECLGVAGVEHLEKAIVLRIEAAAGIVVDGVDAGLESRQRRRVAERGALLDQAVDQCACGQDFQLDLSAQRIIPVVQSEILAVIGRRHQLFDDDSTYRERTLQRTDIGARQVAIRGHVTIRQFLDAVANLHDQHDGQHRGNGHQGDQRHRDSHDLSSDRQADHRNSASGMTMQ